jgi:hypothetical protein
MRGPFVLSETGVHMMVPPKLLGVYALSNTRDHVEILRRSSIALCDEVRAYASEFKYFWFDLAYSERDAYDREAHEYHTPRLRKAESITHPHAPADSDWHCPECQQ